jgi:hypothetical protein
MLTTEIIQAIDARVMQGERAEHQVGTVTETDSAGNAQVVFDGSQGDIPVKVAGNVDAQVGDRVVLVRFGVWWIVIGTMRRIYEPGVLLHEEVLQQPAASVQIPSIPQTHKHLKIVVNAKASSATVFEDALVRFNGDSGLNYANINMRGVQGGGGVTLLTGHDQSSCPPFRIAGSSLDPTVFAGGFGYILDYTSTITSNKMLLAFSGVGDYGNVGQAGFVTCSWGSGGASRVPAAITQIDFVCSNGNFMTNSYFGIYGYGI